MKILITTDWYAPIISIAHERSLKAVREKLLRIYRKENILPPVYLYSNNSLEAPDTIIYKFKGGNAYDTNGTPFKNLSQRF